MRSCSKFFVFSVFLFLLLSVSITWVGAVDEDVVAFGCFLGFSVCLDIFSVGCARVLI